MRLSELFEYIPHGELANLYSSGKDMGILNERHYPKLIANINLALVELHKRFPVLLKQINIQLMEHLSMYVLDSKYALTNTSSTVVKYIMDSTYYPFKNDVVRILSVLNEDCCEYPLNINTNPLSLFTPTYNTLQVPYPINENTIAVEYQAYPAKIPVSTVDLESVDVEIPEFLLEPLMTYLAYKHYSTVGLEKPETLNYLQKFEADCNRINNLGLFDINPHENLKLEINQWV